MNVFLSNKWIVPVYSPDVRKLKHFVDIFFLLGLLMKEQYKLFLSRRVFFPGLCHKLFLGSVWRLAPQAKSGARSSPALINVWLIFRPMTTEQWLIFTASWNKNKKKTFLITPHYSGAHVRVIQNVEYVWLLRFCLRCKRIFLLIKIAEKWSAVEIWMQTEKSQHSF